MFENKPKVTKLLPPRNSLPDPEPISVSDVPVVFRRIVMHSEGRFQITLDVRAEFDKAEELLHAISPYQFRTFMISVASADDSD